MAEWIETWQAALAAVLLVVAPGIGPAYALGLRGLVAWGSAPLFSGAVVGATAVVTGHFGLGWNAAWVLLGSAVASGLALGAWLLGGRRRTGTLRGGRTRLAVALAVGVGGVVATLLQLRRTAAAIGGPDRIAQTYDTAFHLNTVRLILVDNDASSLHMTLIQPEASSAFYPALWHGFVSLVVQLTGVEIAVAANWVTLAATCVAWPLGMLALGRVLFGSRPLLLGLVVPLSFAMTQFPNRLVSFGLLYPNLLSYALLPAAVALAVIATIRTRGRGRLPTTAGALVGLVGLTLAQPNGIFAFAYLVAPLAVQALVQATGRLRRAGRSWWWALAPWPLTVVAVVGGGWLLAKVPIVASFRGRVVWDVTSSWQHALVEAAELSAMHPSTTPNFPEPENLTTGTPSLVVAALVIIGGLVALFVSRWRWLPFSYAILVGLYVLVRGLDLPLRGTITGYWYADPQRFASMLPVIGVPLAVLGVAGIVWSVARLVARLRGAGDRVRLSPYVAAGLAVAVGLGVSVVLPRTAPYRESFAYIAHVYRLDPESSRSTGLLDAHEARLLGRLDEIVPEGVAVAGNPWDGSALVWALSDREAVYPHLRMPMDEAQRTIAERLNEAATDPAVCEAVEELGVGYVLDMGRHLSDQENESFPGLEGLSEAGVAELVAADGNARLYRLTACGG